MIGWESISGLFPLLKRPQVDVDGAGLALLSRYTTAVFLLCATLLTGYMVFGSPIVCTNQNEEEYRYVLGLCWAMSTKTNMEHGNQTGAYPWLNNANVGAQDKIVTHNYYQWSPLVFVFLALAAMIPQIIWRMCERDLILFLLPENKDKIHHQDDEFTKYLTATSKYFCTEMGSVRHTWYGVTYLICEFINLVFVFTIFLALHVFIDYKFYQLGFQVLEYQCSDKPDHMDPLTMLFPLVTRCVMHKIGSSGTKKHLEEMCVLMMNLINRQVFLFVWIWLTVVVVVLAVIWIIRVLTFFSVTVRVWFIRDTTGTNNEAFNAKANRLSFGDWLILYNLLKHFQPSVARRILTHVVEDTFPVRTIEDGTSSPNWVFH